MRNNPSKSSGGDSGGSDDYDDYPPYYGEILTYILKQTATLNPDGKVYFTAETWNLALKMAMSSKGDVDTPKYKLIGEFAAITYNSMSDGGTVDTLAWICKTTGYTPQEVNFILSVMDIGFSSEEAAVLLTYMNNASTLTSKPSLSADDIRRILPNVDFKKTKVLGLVVEDAAETTAGFAEFAYAQSLNNMTVAEAELRFQQRRLAQYDAINGLLVFAIATSSGSSQPASIKNPKTSAEWTEATGVNKPTLSGGQTAYSPAAGAGSLSTQQILQNAAKQANQNISGSGTVPGTLKHSDFANQVRGLNNPNLAVEISYKNGQIVSYGTPGSVRLDVVEYNANGTIKAIYDLKTGASGLTQSRVQQIQNAVGSNVPVFEVRP